MTAARKVCSKCKRDLPADAYGPAMRGACRACRAEMEKARRARFTPEQREKAREHVRAYGRSDRGRDAKVRSDIKSLERLLGRRVFGDDCDES